MEETGVAWTWALLVSSAMIAVSAEFYRRRFANCVETSSKLWVGKLDVTGCQGSC